jgi:hypothetical protein
MKIKFSMISDFVPINLFLKVQSHQILDYLSLSLIKLVLSVGRGMILNFI